MIPAKGMKRIFCWLGRHDWEVRFGVLVFEYRVCLRCGRSEILNASRPIRKEGT